MLRFEHKVALVTGGAGGIGLAIARRFATEGASVAIADIDTVRGPTAERELLQTGPARFIEMDLGRPQDAPRTVAETVGEFGAIDILVNCAAVLGGRHAVPDVPLDDWEHVIRVNLTGTFLITQAVVRRMLEQGRGGAIVNILAIQPIMPLPKWSAYAASKGGLIALNRALAVELAAEGIRVNGIAVGSVYTEAAASAALDPTMVRASGKPPAELDRSAAGLVGRMGLPEDIAGIAAFLASEDASYLAGAIIPADGGRMISRKPDPFYAAARKADD
ncbi:MAG TPA: SDR family oxidoreductase [Bryobacteraceae bacterium]